MQGNKIGALGYIMDNFETRSFIRIANGNGWSINTQLKLGVRQINSYISITSLLLDHLLSINDHLIHVNIRIWENVP